MGVFARASEQRVVLEALSNYSPFWCGSWVLNGKSYPPFNSCEKKTQKTTDRGLIMVSDFRIQFSRKHTQKCQCFQNFDQILVQKQQEQSESNTCLRQVRKNFSMDQQLFWLVGNFFFRLFPIAMLKNEVLSLF